MGPQLTQSTSCRSPDGKKILMKDFEDMIRVDGQTSPTGSQVCDIVSPPATPLTPGTPLGPPTTPTGPLGYRQRLPSFTETDSQSSSANTASDNLSDTHSETSEADWVNFDISPLVKEELKQAIVSRRKTHGLPDVKPDFAPKLPEKLTPEEEERRELQKERNRVAASKCRGKKRVAVERLVDEAEKLETANLELLDEVESLEAERQKLQFLLDIHMPKCSMVTSLSTSPKTESVITSSHPPNNKRARVSTPLQSLAPSPSGGIVSLAGTSRPSTATTPSSDSGYTSSCFPPTPSTTSHSRSSTEPSTPVLLTPTSVMDAPKFPQTISTTMDSSSTDAMLTTTFVQRYLGDDPVEAVDLSFAADDELGSGFPTEPTEIVSIFDNGSKLSSDLHPQTCTVTTTTTSSSINHAIINDHDYDAFGVAVSSSASGTNTHFLTDVSATLDADLSSTIDDRSDTQQMPSVPAEITLQSLLQTLQPTDDQQATASLLSMLGFNSYDDPANSSVCQASPICAIEQPQQADSPTHRADFPDLGKPFESSLSAPASAPAEQSQHHAHPESESPEIMDFGLCNTS